MGRPDLAVLWSPLLCVLPASTCPLQSLWKPVKLPQRSLPFLHQLLDFYLSFFFFMKSTLINLTLGFFSLLSPARRAHRYRRHHHKVRRERRKHKRHGHREGGHHGGQLRQGHSHAHFWTKKIAAHFPFLLCCILQLACLPAVLISLNTTSQLSTYVPPLSVLPSAPHLLAPRQPAY